MVEAPSPIGPEYGEKEGGLKAPFYFVTKRLEALVGTLIHNRNVQIDLALTAVGSILGYWAGSPVLGGVAGSIARPGLRYIDNKNRLDDAIHGHAVDRTQYDANHFIVPLTKAVITCEKQLPVDTQPDSGTI